jgi:hypothetical protein
MYTTETDRMLAEGGVMQEGNTVDPVSGNDVPPGALQEEVRDDIDAQISEGEFIFPADVTRYIGLSTLMKMRDKAKEGLKKMEEIGQMGNAEEVPNAEALHGGESEMDDETFGAEVDSIMNEDMGTEEPAFAEGGYVDPANAPLYKSSPIKGFEMVTMTNESGNTIYIPHVNGKPLLAVPAGYIAKKGILPTIEDPAAVAAKAAAGKTVDTGGGGDGPTSGPAPGTSQGGAVPSISNTGVVTAANTGLTNTQAGILGTVIGLVTGVPLLGLVGRQMNDTLNKGYAKDAADVVQGIVDGNEMGIPGGATPATAGPQGTGGQAANAGTAAAAAAVAAGYSSEAVAAAAQAAANATLGGANATSAAQAGVAAAIAAESVNNSGLTVAAENEAVAVQNTGAISSPVSAPDITTTNFGPEVDTSLESQGAYSGNTGADSGYSGGTTGAGNEGGGIGAGEGLAKGGFVTKKNKPAVKAKRGLASRK